MLDETRCEFGVTIEARNRDEAWSILEEDYPESRCVQLETTDGTAERERLIYLQAAREWENEAGYYDEGDDE
jgi:hypothetical protein